ncbi:MAG: site-specific integrase, partial [Myxococcota bacterium]
DVLSRWIMYQRARCKPRSVHLYKIVRKRFSLSWGDLRPEQITALVVEEFQEGALLAGLSPRTINHQVGIALSALKWAADRGLTQTEPPKWNRLKVNGTHARKYLTTSEVEKLLATVREPRWHRLEVVVMLALYAGLRQQETAWLTWEDVDLADGWLYVRSKRGWSPKSAASERTVPIADELQTYLSTAPRACRRWVASQSPGVQWCRRHLGAETRRLFRAAGVDDGGPHTLHRLRGPFATTVLRGGGDLESLREVLGHSVLSVTAGYLSATSESMRRAVRGVRFSSK